jgi:hypothetical protein
MFMVQRELAPKLKKAGEEIGRISDNVGFWVTNAGQIIAPVSGIVAFIAGEHRIAVGAVISTAIFETVHRAFEQNIAKYSSGRADEVETSLEAARERTEVVFQSEAVLQEQQELAKRRLRSRLLAIRNGYQGQITDSVSEVRLNTKAKQIQKYIEKLDLDDPGEALKFLEIQIYAKLAQAGRTPAAQYHDTALNQTRIDIETLSVLNPAKAKELKEELNKVQAGFSSSYQP